MDFNFKKIQWKCFATFHQKIRFNLSHFTPTKYSMPASNKPREIFLFSPRLDYLYERLALETVVRQCLFAWNPREGYGLCTFVPFPPSLAVFIIFVGAREIGRCDTTPLRQAARENHSRLPAFVGQSSKLVDT